MTPDHKAPVWKILDTVFDQLFGLPCWNVQQGHGSFLTFEFGDPSLEIGRVVPRNPAFPGSRARRTVNVKGQWHLRIHCCGWRISQDGEQLCFNESSTGEIRKGCYNLNGQALLDLKFRPEAGRSYFTFDLGGKLVTGTYEVKLQEQWVLYCPDGNVLTYRSDGAFSYAPETGTTEEKVFRYLDEK